MAHIKAENVSMDVPNGVARDIVEDAVNTENKGECSMDNLAGLLALMNGNKGMDLPGLLALCKEKGYDKGFGGEGMFMFVFLMLFLFAGGGWGNLNQNGRNQVAALAGQNLQDIIGLYDRLAANGQVTTQGFMQLDAKVCSAINETVNAVNAAAARNYDATRNVGDAVRDCCCTMRANMADLGCKIDKVAGEVGIAYERTINHFDRRACELENQISQLAGEMKLGFERNQCVITNTAIQQESARKDREIASLKEAFQAQQTAQAVAQQLQNFALQNYIPTAYGKSSSGGGAAGGATT